MFEFTATEALIVSLFSASGFVWFLYIWTLFPSTDNLYDRNKNSVILKRMGSTVLLIFVTILILQLKGPPAWTGEFWCSVGICFDSRLLLGIILPTAVIAILFLGTLLDYKLQNITVFSHVKL